MRLGYEHTNNSVVNHMGDLSHGYLPIKIGLTVKQPHYSRRIFDVKGEIQKLLLFSFRRKRCGHSGTYAAMVQL
jgi:hypothetical protein